MKIHLTYFKTTGKYYSDDWYESKLPDDSGLWHFWEEIEGLFEHHKPPGLVECENEFITLIEVPNHPHNHPHLLFPKSIKDFCISTYYGRRR